MKTIHTQVFTLDELPKAARERAREWYRKGLEFDSEPTIEDAKQCLALVGVTVEQVYFSGFSSQGDGACFEGTWKASDVQPGKLKEHAPTDATLHRIAAEFERIAAAFPGGSFDVRHRGRYCHRFCTDFTVSLMDLEGNEIDSPEREAAEKALIEVTRDAMAWIYRQLEADWDWQIGDEQVDEVIRANEYTFTAEGERFG